MNLQIGGATLAVILAGMLIALGVAECQRGPLDPELADNLSEAQKDWLTVEHRIKRFDPSLTHVTRDGQVLTIFYRPAPDPEQGTGWIGEMLRVVGYGLAALNGAPGGKQYTEVRIKARMLADDDVHLEYDMQGFDALKTQSNGYRTFASAPRALAFSPPALARARDDCRNLNVQAFNSQFCDRVKEAAVIQP